VTSHVYGEDLEVRSQARQGALIAPPRHRLARDEHECGSAVRPLHIVDSDVAGLELAVDESKL
jgi:hypothetical protein